MDSGIYIIKNIKTLRVYVGQTTGFTHRWGEHQQQFRRKKGVNRHIQNSWNKHGESAFRFEIVERVSNLDHLTAYEQSYLDYYRKLPGGVYNSSGPVDAPMRGMKHSEEAKHKMKDSATGVPNSPEHRAAISKGNRGKKKPPGWAEEMSTILKGRKMTEEQCRKLSETRKGMKLTPEHKAAISAAVAAARAKKKAEGWHPQPLSEEHKAKIKASWARRKAKNTQND